MSQSLKELQQKALSIKALYAQLQKQQGHAKWDASDYMAGFVTHVGELSELVMAKKGIRYIKNADAKLAHELSDCLYSILVLSSEFGIDLEQEFDQTMNNLALRINKKMKVAA